MSNPSMENKTQVLPQVTFDKIKTNISIILILCTDKKLKKKEKIHRISEVFLIKLKNKIKQDLISTQDML